jgi:transposase InsO family protein
LPKTIISNRGLQFVSQFMRDLLKLLGIKGNPSTAYHLQTDGQTEWMNQVWVNGKEITTNQPMIQPLLSGAKDWGGGLFVEITSNIDVSAVHLWSETKGTLQRSESAKFQ